MIFSRRGDKALSLRLHTLATYYNNTSVIYDIGCDHGLLGLSFTSRDEVREIYLVDPSPLVIRSLRQNIKTSHIPRGNLSININQEEGQNLQLSPSPKCIFIAGMGGKEIGEILLSLQSQLLDHDRVVISPHRNILELRKTLSTTELGLVSESVLEEDGHFYLILVLEKRDNLPTVTPFGTYLWQTAVGKAYLNKELRHFGLHQDALSRAYVEYLLSLLAACND